MLTCPAHRWQQLQDGVRVGHERGCECFLQRVIELILQLNFQGNQLNYLDTLFRIGYALFLIPSQLILTRIRPSIWLPALEMAWGVMTGECYGMEISES